MQVVKNWRKLNFLDLKVSMTSIQFVENYWISRCSFHLSFLHSILPFGVLLVSGNFNSGLLFDPRFFNPKLDISVSTLSIWPLFFQAPNFLTMNSSTPDFSFMEFSILWIWKVRGWILVHLILVCCWFQDISTPNYFSTQDFSTPNWTLQISIPSVWPLFFQPWTLNS